MLTLDADGSRLDAILAAAATAGKDVPPTAISATSRAEPISPPRPASASARSAAAASRAARAAADERTIAEGAARRREAAQQYEKDERQRRDAQRVLSDAKQRSAQESRRAKTNSWKQEQRAAAERASEAERRERREREAAQRRQLAADAERRERRAAELAAQQAEAARLAAAEAARRAEEQRPAAREAALALARRREAEAEALRERLAAEAAAAAAAADEEGRQLEAEAAAARREEMLCRRRERLEAAEAEAEAERAAAAAREAVEAAARGERARRAQEAEARRREADRERLASWRQSKEALRDEAEARRRSEAAEEEAARRRRVRDFEAKRAAATGGAGCRSGLMDGYEGSCLGWRGGGDVADLTADELAVARLAEAAEAEGERSDGECDDECDDGGGVGGGVAARQHPARFLSPHERPGQAALVSYPRSGNSLLRSLLERCSGVLTGSDALEAAALSRELATYGLAGEGVTDGRVWLVKSHWPERRGSAEVAVAAAVLLVRSPFDALDSYFNFVLTKTHTRSVLHTEYDRLSSQWAELVQREVAVWKAFHAHWLAQPVPTLAIRYEDLLQPERRAETLRLVASFLCARVTPAEGASPAAAAKALRGMLGRVEEAAAESAADDAARSASDAAAAASSGGIYRPRRGAAGSGLCHFSEAQRRAVVESCGAELSLFKYETDVNSERLGLPLDGPPHAIYLDPRKPKADGALAAGGVVLNRGKGLRPHEDARGWRWRGEAAGQMDGSLIAEGRVARMEAEEE